MNISYRNLSYQTHIVPTNLLTFSSGPWIPQTPDSQQEPDVVEQWQEGNQEYEEEH